MKFKFNGIEADSLGHRSFGVVPEVRDGLILMRAGDTLEVEGLRFIATKSGYYDFPPNEGKHYIEMEPLKSRYETFIKGAGIVTFLETTVTDEEVICKFRTGTVWSAPLEITVKDNGVVICNYKSFSFCSSLFGNGEEVVFVGERKKS